MTTLLQRWEHWWLRETPPHALAIFRIGFGAFLLLYFGLMLPNVPLMFSTDGIVLPNVDWIGVPSPVVALTIHLVLLLSLLGVTIGYGMRRCGCIAFVIYVYYWLISFYLFGGSFDRIFLFCLAVLVCSGADKTLSLHMKLKRGSWLAWEPVSILPQRILAVQISATYLGVGWQTIVLPAWQGGEILPYSFSGPWGTPLARWMLSLNLPLWFYDGSVNLVKIFECLLPFGLWMKKARLWFMLGGAVFHVLIALFLGIWWFLVLVPGYVVFFDGEEVRKWTKRHS